MHSKNPIDVLSKGSLLNPKTDQEIAAAMTEHVQYLNSWLDSRLKCLFITLEIAEEEAAENANSACLQLITAIRHELRLTEKLVVPLEGFATEDGGYLAPSPTQMVAALAQTRADWVDFLVSVTNPAVE